MPVSPSSGVPSHLCQFFIQPASANEKPLQRPWMKRVPYPLLTDDQLGMPMDLVLVQAQSALTSISEFSTAKEQGFYIINFGLYIFNCNYTQQQQQRIQKIMQVSILII